MPLRARSSDLFALLTAAADNTVVAADLLHRMLEEHPDAVGLAKEIHDREHEGDRITRELVGRLDSKFSSPLDRDEVRELATALDDIVDLTDEVAEYLVLYRIEAPMQQSIELAKVLAAACRAIAAAVPHLQGRGDLSVHTEEVNRLEEQGDRLSREAIAALFDTNVDPMVVLRWKDLFERLEEAIDATEKAAHVLAGIRIRHT